jgi:hypothetical protein
MKFDVVLLMMSANCIAFGREENFVEIVVSAKQFFHSGCVYLLQYQEAGKCNKVTCSACRIRLCGSCEGTIGDKIEKKRTYV